MAKRPVRKADMPCNSPKRAPDHPKKSHIVKACANGKEKIIRFGEQGAKTAGAPKAGESEAMKKKRASFKARHAKNIAKGKMSAAFWADKVKWTIGPIGIMLTLMTGDAYAKPQFEDRNRLSSMQTNEDGPQ